MNQQFQLVHLNEPIKAARPGNPPIVININVVPEMQFTSGGPVYQPERVESYVLFSALPEELQRRVKMAVSMLVSSI